MGTSSKQGFQARERPVGGCGRGRGFHFGGELAEQRLQGGEGESELDLLPAIAQGGVQATTSMGAWGGAVWRKRALLSWPSRTGFNSWSGAAWRAPFGGDHLRDLLQKRVLNRAHFLAGRAGPAGAAHQAVHDGTGPGAWESAKWKRRATARS